MAKCRFQVCFFFRDDNHYTQLGFLTSKSLPRLRNFVTVR